MFPNVKGTNRLTLPTDKVKKQKARFIDSLEQRVEKIRSSDRVASITENLNRASDNARGAYNKAPSSVSKATTWASNASKAAASAVASKFASIIPNVETTTKLSIVCLLIVVIPVFFFVYMLTKLQSNCNIAWVLSWSKMHPCWVDLGPHGSNWEFPANENSNHLAHAAYTYCSYTEPSTCD